MDNKLFVPSVVVLAALLLIGGLLGTKAWNPSWNPFNNVEQSGGVIEKSLENLLASDTYKYDGLASIAIDSPVDLGVPGGRANVGLSWQASFDGKNKENWKGLVNLALVFNMEGTSITATGQVMSLANDIYFKIDTLPAIPLAFLNQDLINNVKGQWIKMTPQDLQATSTMDQQKTQAILNQILALMVKENIFKIEKNLGDEKIKAGNCSHYLVSVDKEGVKAIVPQFLSLAGEQLSGEEKVQYQQKVETLTENLSQNIDMVWQKIKGIELEIWVEKQGGKLAKIKFEREIKGEELQSFLTNYTATLTDDKKTQMEQALSQTTLTIKLENEYFDFGKSVNIEAPETFKSFQEVFGSGLLQSSSSTE